MKIRILLVIMVMIALNNGLQAQNKTPKVLIAYFSRSGNTRIIANQIKEFTGGDVFEIKTAKAYSTDYTTCTEEAKAEKNANARPPLQGKMENMADYDVVFIGYPNWWGTMPMAILTFIDSYNFSGKTLIPFCTHGGGGVQQCFKDFSKHTAKYSSKEGFIVSGGSADGAKAHVEKWVAKQLQSIK